MPIKLVIIYTLSVVVFSFVIFTGISYRKNKFFNQKDLNNLIYSTSDFRVKYKSPCDNIIRGDPDVADSWVKINFHCPDGVQNSTLTTIIFDKQTTWLQIMNEFSRILGFSADGVIDNPDWQCFVNKKIKLENKIINNWDREALNRESIDCIDSQLGLSYLDNYYEKQ